MSTTKAKRGDLVALVTEQVTYNTSHGTTRATRVEVEEVTSITREGAVKATRSLAYEDAHPTPIVRRHGLVARYVIGAATIDKAAAVAAVKAHTWPGHDQVRPFDSLDDCRAAIRPHLKART